MTSRPYPLHRDAKPVERVPIFGYVAHEYELQEVASRLRQHSYRGAIIGPSGCGKTTMLQALGDELMDHGLSPLPLCVDSDGVHSLPRTWRRTICQARHTDALLLDGYDLLPRWARAWVWARSMRAGAVVVTAQRAVRYKTLAEPTPTVALLRHLSEQLHTRPHITIDYEAIFKQCKGNLREALQHINQLVNAGQRARRPGKMRAG